MSDRQADVLCEVDGCDQVRRTRTWCSKHYSRWLKHGDPTKTLSPNRGLPLADRFWSHVSAPDDNGCRKWTGTKSRDGYGQFRASGRTQRAHQVAYRLAHGPIPDGLEIDHVRARGCRSTSCCNPDHLEAVTSQENNRRRWEGRRAVKGPPRNNASKTHCPRNHPYDEHNTLVDRYGGRRCGECNKERCRRNRAAKRESKT